MRGRGARARAGGDRPAGRSVPLPGARGGPSRRPARTASSPSSQGDDRPGRGVPYRATTTCAGAVDLAAPDLDHPADPDRLVAAQVEDPLQDQVGVQARGAIGRGIGRLERHREQDARVERAVMIGIARQDEAMGQDFVAGRHPHAHRARMVERLGTPGNPRVEMEKTNAPGDRPQPAHAGRRPDGASPPRRNVTSSRRRIRDARHSRRRRISSYLARTPTTVPESGSHPTPKSTPRENFRSVHRQDEYFSSRKFPRHNRRSDP